MSEKITNEIIELFETCESQEELKEVYDEICNSLENTYENRLFNLEEECKYCKRGKPLVDGNGNTVSIFGENLIYKENGLISNYLNIVFCPICGDMLGLKKEEE